MLLYRALTTGTKIANWAKDGSSESRWGFIAAQLKSVINSNLWDARIG